MIYEYALEPELVATWGTKQNSIIYSSAFGFGQGRAVSNYPKKWSRMVYSCARGSEMEIKRLVELLKRIEENMIKRRDPIYDGDRRSWIENALLEHKRYPFFAIMAKNNLNHLSQIICEDDLADSPCPSWDIPHGITVNRNAAEMAATINMMLGRCRWVKFIDPYLSRIKWGHKQSMMAFLRILGTERPVGPLEFIEIHTDEKGPSLEFLKDFYEEIIPAGLTVTLFQWKEIPGGQRLHNRYILTDLGGVSFHNGLDAGEDGETDDITRLDYEQYRLHCTQYNRATSFFEKAEAPLELTSKMEGEKA